MALPVALQGVKYDKERSLLVGSAWLAWIIRQVLPGPPNCLCSGLLQALQGVDLPEEEEDDFDFATEITLPDLPEDDGSLHVPQTRRRAARVDK